MPVDVTTVDLGFLAYFDCSCPRSRRRYYFDQVRGSYVGVYLYLAVGGRYGRYDLAVAPACARSS